MDLAAGDERPVPDAGEAPERRVVVVAFGPVVVKLSLSDSSDSFAANALSSSNSCFA
ncbi:hypothetical protein [Nonomuraea sp. GTA35]|uniref:hypothetical protein n=1 Tax=Nonomuraea sp. GTA35 TaxID=1676746 RepID=UPI0035C0185F